MSKLKTVEEIKDLEIAGKIIKDVFLQIEKKIKPGITSIELDKLAYDIIIKANAIPLFLNHEGFPNTICASPNNKKIKPGITSIELDKLAYDIIIKANAI